MSAACSFEDKLDDVLDLVSLALDESCGAESPDTVCTSYDRALCSLAAALDTNHDNKIARRSAAMIRDKRRALSFLHALDWTAAMRTIHAANQYADYLHLQTQSPERVAFDTRQSSVDSALRTSDAVSVTESLDSEKAVVRRNSSKSLGERLLVRRSSLKNRDRLYIARALDRGLRRASSLYAQSVAKSSKVTLRQLPMERTTHWSIENLWRHVVQDCGELPYGESVTREYLQLLDKVVASTRPFGLWRHGASHVVRDKHQQVIIFAAHSDEHVSAALVLREMCVDSFFAMSLLALETCAFLAYAHRNRIALSLRYRFANVVQRLVTKWVGVVYERVYRQTALLVVHTGSQERLALLELDRLVRRMPQLFDQEQRSAIDLVSNFAVGLDKALASTVLDDSTSPIIEAASAGLRVESQNLARYATHLAALFSEPSETPTFFSKKLFDAVRAASWNVWHSSVPFLVTESALLEHNAVHHIRASAK